MAKKVLESIIIKLLINLLFKEKVLKLKTGAVFLKILLVRVVMG
jgi:hypothetical protein